MKLNQLHIHQGSSLFPIFCRAASTVTPRFPKVTFTPSIHLTSVYLVLALHILPTSTPFWPYGTHPFLPNAQTVNTLLSTLFANSISIPAPLRTSSFLTLSIRELELSLYPFLKCFLNHFLKIYNNYTC